MLARRTWWLFPLFSWFDQLQVGLNYVSTWQTLTRESRILFSLKASANEETFLWKHCFPECFLGAQTCGKQCFLVRYPKTPFHWKQTFAHAQFRKYSLRDHRIKSTLFPLRANGEAFVAETKCFSKKSNIFCFSETKNVSANVSFARKQENI